MASNAIVSRSALETDASANARAVEIFARHQSCRKQQTIKDSSTGKTTSGKQVQHKHLPTQDGLRRWVKNIRTQTGWVNPNEKFWAKQNLALQKDNETVKWVTSEGKDGGIIVPIEHWGAMIRDAHIKTDADGAFVHLGRDATLTRLREADQDNTPKYKTPQKEIILSFIKGCPQCKEGKKREGKKREGKKRKEPPSDDNNDAPAAAAAAPAPPRPAKRPRRGASILARPSSSSSSAAAPAPMADHLHQQPQPQHQHQQPGPDTAQHDTNLGAVQPQHQQQHDINLGTFQPQGVVLPAAQYHGGPGMAYFDDGSAWGHSTVEQPQQQQWQGFPVAQGHNDWAYNAQFDLEEGFNLSPVDDASAAQQQWQGLPVAQDHNDWDYNVQYDEEEGFTVGPVEDAPAVQQQWQGLPVGQDHNDWAYNVQSGQEEGFTMSPVDDAPAAQPQQHPTFPEGTINLEALAPQGLFPWELPDQEFLDLMAAGYNAQGQ